MSNEERDKLPHFSQQLPDSAGFTHKCVLCRVLREVFALNFLTAEGVNHFPDGCDGTVEALITDYFIEGQGDDESNDENNRNESKIIKI